MKKINTALCSFGMSGMIFHAPFIHAHPGFELYGVWERSTKKAAEKYPGIISFDSFEELVADKNIELLVVNTPIHTHYEFTKKALEAGKHVLVEKAFTVNAEEAQSLAALAKQKDLKLCIFQNRRYDSDLKTVKKIIDSGVLGEIKEAEFHFDRYNLSLSAKAHKEDGNPGAGILHDLGSHLADQAFYLFGMPKVVSAALRITRPGSKVNDYMDALLFYPDLMLRLKAGFIVKEIPASYVLHGTKGSFLKSRADVQEDELKAGKAVTDSDWGLERESMKGLLVTDFNGETIKQHIASDRGNYMELFDGLYEAIALNGPVPVAPDEAVQVMRILDAIAESSRCKKQIIF